MEGDAGGVGWGVPVAPSGVTGGVDVKRREVIGGGTAGEREQFNWGVPIFSTIGDGGLGVGATLGVGVTSRVGATSGVGVTSRVGATSGVRATSGMIAIAVVCPGLRNSRGREGAGTGSSTGVVGVAWSSTAGVKLLGVGIGVGSSGDGSAGAVGSESDVGVRELLE